MPARRAKGIAWVFIAIFSYVLFEIAVNFSAVSKAADDNADTVIAKSLAAMLSAGLTVISRNQDLIDNPDVEDKGLNGKSVLAQAQQLFQETTGSDPSSIDPALRQGRLLRVEMNAIVEVMNAHQRELNQRGIGFKGFIPATFGRLVAESFGKGAAGDAEMKITAPLEFIRNRKAGRMIGRAPSFARSFCRRAGRRESSTPRSPRAKAVLPFASRCPTIIRHPVSPAMAVRKARST